MSGVTAPAARAAACAALLLASTGLACAGGSSWRGGTLRMSDVVTEGDDTRRASMRMVASGLEREERSPEQAVSAYERAIQVDATNPYAYLALARHYARRDPDRALQYLDQAELLLGSEDALSPRVEPHLLGIRGTALRARGDTARGDALLERAAAMSSAWEDGRLAPDELK